MDEAQIRAVLLQADSQQQQQTTSLNSLESFQKIEITGKSVSSSAGKQQQQQQQ